jgi:tRNA (cmo5U34)-methyltransferase
MVHSSKLSPAQFVALSGASVRDSIFEDQDLPGDFEFSNQVSKVFPDMIGRSVPGYWDNVTWIGTLAQRFIKPDSVVYDLGCSLGAIGWAIDQELTVPAQIVGVDNSVPMVEALGLNLKAAQPRATWRVIHGDVAQLSYETASVFVLHYCLQFVPLVKREVLLTRLYASLEPGGALFLSEKIAGESAESDEWLRTEHHGFKLKMGYSDKEIAAKARSIATMMPLETASVHEERLRSLGFKNVVRWRQSLNFCSWVACK